MNYVKGQFVSEKSKGYLEAQVEMFALENMRMSVVNSMSLMNFTVFGQIRHPMNGKDRLGNPDVDFPIGAAFGDQDSIVDSGGIDTIIKNNKHFASGKSQLFQIKSSGH